MSSNYLFAELSATCNALGYCTGDTYHTDPYVKETITDLIRYLRRDDEDHTIRRNLGNAKILQTDLLPILIHHSDKEELFDVLLRLLVNLTNPALLIYQEELPVDRISRHYYIEIIAHLQSYKEAFTDQRVWEVLTGKLEKLLNVAYEDRDEDQSRTMERILVLARNVLQVPADAEAEKRPDSDASVHDQVLWSLHQAGMVELFLYIASTDREQQYYHHILEIISLMLREQNPASLASAALQRSVEEKERDEKELLDIRRREILEKQAKIKKYAGSRHSRFGGTFVMKDIKSISDKDLIYHKPLTKAVSLSLDFEKQRAKVPKNRVALTYQSSERRSAFSVRLFLKEFCVEFLNGAYNPLMNKVRENLVRAVGQPNDETYYFWAMKFFMEFNRMYKFQVKLISETMHQQIFHFVQTQMEKWLEMMISDKKHIPVWSRRVHQALKAYQELLMTLLEMDRSPDETVRKSAAVIKSNVFYQSEYRELVVFLFNVFTEIKFSRDYLKDLVETTHIFMKMLEEFCKRHQTLVVQEKPKKRRVKKKKPAKSRPQVNLQELWDSIAPELSAVVQGFSDQPTNYVPFDVTSGLSPDEEKVGAMKRIKAEMMQNNLEQALGLLRAAREVWPENDSFGRENMPPEEEFLAMKDIFMADIGELPEPTHEENEEDNEADNEEEEELGDDGRDIVIPESVFKFSDFVGRFASPKVLAPVCLLLDNFELNSSRTNKYILKLLHRVAVDCKMPQMLFQASVFRTFQRAFASPNPDHKEIQRLGKFIVREFVKSAKINKKIFMEILFWKNTKEAYELQYGYGAEEKKSHSAKNCWAEEHEDELRRLAQEYEENTPENEPDAVAWIMKNMINQNRSRRAVIKKLKELYLFVGTMKPKKSKAMTEEEITQLKSLYEMYKDSPDPMNCILGRLSVPRSRKMIADTLLNQGLISDKKELRKKKTKSGKSGKEMEWGDRSDDESIYDSWSDEDPGPSTSAGPKKKTVKLRRIGQPSVAQMCCNLRKVVNAGEELREALEWLREALEEMAEDLASADDAEEGTALLPLTPASIQAMDNPVFMQLLDIFSIDKPTDQEIYWRVPGTWKAEDYSKRITLIKDALEGNLPDINPDEVGELVKLPGIPKKTPKKDKKKKPRKGTAKSLNLFVREDNGAARETEENSRLPSSASEDENEVRSGNILRHPSSSSDDLNEVRSGNIPSRAPSSSSNNEDENPPQVRPQSITSEDSSDDNRKFDSVSVNISNKRKPDVLESDSDKENNLEISMTLSNNLKSDSSKPVLKKKKVFCVQSDSEDEVLTSNDKKGDHLKQNSVEENSLNQESLISDVIDESETSKDISSNIVSNKNIIASDSDDEINSYSTHKLKTERVSKEHNLKRRIISSESDSD